MDRGIKAPLYGRAGIPHYWLLALEDETLEMYSEPSAQGYTMTRIARRGAVVTLPIPGAPQIALDDLLPPAQR